MAKNKHKNVEEIYYPIPATFTLESPNRMKNFYLCSAILFYSLIIIWLGYAMGKKDGKKCEKISDEK